MTRYAYYVRCRRAGTPVRRDSYADRERAVERARQHNAQIVLSRTVLGEQANPNHMDFDVRGEAFVVEEEV